ncbi:MAG: hypothetical protein GY796_19010 [Chloroflexi bacterium]|nr:hypothetical protein [Chloroflexota bacterium]
MPSSTNANRIGKASNNYGKKPLNPNKQTSQNSECMGEYPICKYEELVETSEYDVNSLDAQTRLELNDVGGEPTSDRCVVVLNAARPQDWADVSRMLGTATDAKLNEVRQLIAHYSPEDSTPS